MGLFDNNLGKKQTTLPIHTLTTLDGIIYFFAKKNALQMHCLITKVEVEVDGFGEILLLMRKLR